MSLLLIYSLQSLVILLSIYVISELILWFLIRWLRLFLGHFSWFPKQQNQFGLKPGGRLLLWGTLAKLTWLFLPWKTTIPYTPIIAKGIAYAGALWLLWQLSDLVQKLLANAADKTKHTFDDLLAPLIGRTLKIICLIIGVIMLANAAQLPIETMITSLGVGGIAVAMAAKETIANVFGSMTIVMDRPFNIGDWVIIGTIEGTVEQVGFRSTRIRTFYQSEVTVPNATLLTARIDNMGQRPYRRIKHTLGVTYETPPEKIEAFCEGIRTLIKAMPAMRKDTFYVYFNSYGDFSLNILIYCFLEVANWDEELKERHAFFKAILQLAKDMDVHFAYPTQQLYITRNTPHDN